MAMKLTPKRPTAVKTVACHHCGKMAEFPKRAMSAVCPHCNKRLILEDVVIRGYHAVRELATCGEVVVERKGHVVAAIKSLSLTIRGKVDGQVLARERVILAKTSILTGSISAPCLEVEIGAVMDCHVSIVPGASQEQLINTAPPPQPPAPASPQKKITRRTGTVTAPAAKRSRAPVQRNVTSSRSS